MQAGFLGGGGAPSKSKSKARAAAPVDRPIDHGGQQPQESPQLQLSPEQWERNFAQCLQLLQGDAATDESR